MYQKLILIGNLGRDPEMRDVNGTPVTSFSVATSRTWNDKSGNRQSETTWFRISVWGAQATSCAQYLAKGSKVLVEGRMQPDENGGPRVWESNGEHRASFEVRADSVRFMSSREETGAAAASSDGGWGDSQDEDDIPF